MSQPPNNPYPGPQGQPPYQQPPQGYPPYQQPPPGQPPYYQQPPQGYPQYQQPGPYQPYPQPVVVTQKKGPSVLLIILAVIGIIAVGGCVSVFLIIGATGHAIDQAVKDTGTGQTVTGRSGQQLSNSGWGLSVSNSERNTTGYQQFGTPSAGNIFLAVEVNVSSTDGKHAADASPFYTKLKDSAGHIYTPSFVGGKQPELGSQSDISQGQKVSGWVTFEVPSNASGFVFIYEPILGPKFEITL